MTLSLNYDATYDWNAGSRATVNDSINLGNVIQNTNNLKEIKKEFKRTIKNIKIAYIEDLFLNDTSQHLRIKTDEYIL